MDEGVSSKVTLSLRGFLCVRAAAKYMCVSVFECAGGVRNLVSNNETQSKIYYQEKEKERESESDGDSNRI